MEVKCRICQVVLAPKNKRLIFSDSFVVFEELKEVLGYSPTKDDCLSNYVCYHCLSKLNRLNKISFDIKHKVDILKREKSTLITQLKSLLPPVTVEKHARDGVGGDNTPKCIAKKRVIVHTPTPRKVKRPLLFTPNAKRTTPRKAPSSPCSTKPLTGPPVRRKLDIPPDTLKVTAF